MNGQQQQQHLQHLQQLQQHQQQQLILQQQHQHMLLQQAHHHQQQVQHHLQHGNSPSQKISNQQSELIDGVLTAGYPISMLEMDPVSGLPRPIAHSLNKNMMIKQKRRWPKASQASSVPYDTEKYLKFDHVSQTLIENDPEAIGFVLLYVRTGGLPGAGSGTTGIGGKQPKYWCALPRHQSEERWFKWVNVVGVFPPGMEVDCEIDLQPQSAAWLHLGHPSEVKKQRLISFQNSENPNDVHRRREFCQVERAIKFTGKSGLAEHDRKSVKEATVRLVLRINCEAIYPCSQMEDAIPETGSHLGHRSQEGDSHLDQQHPHFHHDHDEGISGDRNANSHPANVAGLSNNVVNPNEFGHDLSSSFASITSGGESNEPSTSVVATENPAGSSDRSSSSSSSSTSTSTSSASSSSSSSSATSSLSLHSGGSRNVETFFPVVSQTDSSCLTTNFQFSTGPQEAKIILVESRAKYTAPGSGTRTSPEKSFLRGAPQLMRVSQDPETGQLCWKVISFDDLGLSSLPYGEEMGQQDSTDSGNFLLSGPSAQMMTSSPSISRIKGEESVKNKSSD